MAKIHNSIIGQISGRIGNSVAVILNGKTYLRNYVPPTDRKSDKQLVQRAKFALAMKSLRAFRPVIAVTFGTGQSNYAKAMSLFFEKAIQGNYPDFTCNWANLPICPNNLDLPDGISCITERQSTIRAIWPTATNGKASAEDKVGLLIYYTENSLLDYFSAIAERKDGALVLENMDPDELRTHQMWLLFTSTKIRKPSVAVHLSI